MLRCLWGIVCCVVLLVPAASIHAQPPALQTSQALANIPELQVPVSADCVGVPLSKAFAVISKNTPIALTVNDPYIRNQRVTLHISNRPLYEVMGQIVAVFSHDAKVTPQFHFVLSAPERGTKRPTYALRHTKSAEIAEQEALSQSYREALQTLKDMRDLVAMPVKKRVNYSTHLDPKAVAAIDFSIDAYALQSLSDEQLTSLLNGATISIPSAPLRPVFQRLYTTAMDSRRREGAVVETPPFEMTKEPTFALQINSDFFENSPDGPAPFMISMIPGETTERIKGGTWLNKPLSDDDLILLPEPDNDKSPVLDVSPLLHGEKVTEEQRGDLSFVLLALAKTANINLYQEHFIKSSQHTFAPANEKGTLPQIMNALCRTWQCNVRRSGSNYLLWNQSWAKDRQADISEFWISRWQRFAAPDAPVALSDILPFAKELNWPQFKTTLPVALPYMAEKVSEIGFRHYLCLKITAYLSQEERATALTTDGLAFSALSANVRSNILDVLQEGRGGFGPMVRINSGIPYRPTLWDTQIQQSRLRLLPPQFLQDTILGFNSHFVSFTLEDGTVLWKP